MDAQGYSVVISAIAVGLAQVITTYFQSKALNTRITEVKDVATATKDVADVAVHNQADTGKKLDEIHVQTNSTLSNLQKQYEAALNEIETLRRIAQVNLENKAELARVVQRTEVKTIPVEVKPIEVKIKP